MLSVLQALHMEMDSKTSFSIKRITALVIEGTGSEGNPSCVMVHFDYPVFDVWFQTYEKSHLS